MTVVIDGFRGEVILDPDAEALRRYEARADVHRARSQRLAAIRDVPSQTTDGTPVHLHGQHRDARGDPDRRRAGRRVGGAVPHRVPLPRARRAARRRTSSTRTPSRRSRAWAGGRVTFRTLDLGGDKLPPSVRIPSGTNPAMGLRSIRYSLNREDVFRTQLRALYRAAAVGPMQILFPLISGVAELRAAKQICAEVCAELEREGIPHARQGPARRDDRDARARRSSPISWPRSATSSASAPTISSSTRWPPIARTSTSATSTTRSTRRSCARCARPSWRPSGWASRSRCAATWRATRS